jgi:hypothetical protein
VRVDLCVDPAVSTCALHSSTHRHHVQTPTHTGMPAASSTSAFTTTTSPPCRLLLMRWMHDEACCMCTHARQYSTPHTHHLRTRLGVHSCSQPPQLPQTRKRQPLACAHVATHTLSLQTSLHASATSPAHNPTDGHSKRLPGAVSSVAESAQKRFRLLHKVSRPRRTQATQHPGHIWVQQHCHHCRFVICHKICQAAAALAGPQV